VTVAGLILLALPAWAQQKDAATSDDTNKNEAAKSAPASPATSGAASVAAPSRNVFALPAAPRPTPFPGPAASGISDEAPGKMVPRYEVAGGYSYVNFHPGSPFQSFNSHGGTGSFTYNASRYLGLTAELGAYNYNRDAGAGGVSGNFYSWLFGPRLNLRKFDYFVPFAEFLVGGSHGDNILTGTQSQNAFALAAGGGVDIVLSKHIAWRFAQIDYLMTNFSGLNLGGNARQDNLRLGTGIVLRFGLPSPPPPPAPKRPPVASCSASPASVYAGSSDTVAVHVNATSPDGLPLTYSYAATGGAVEGTGPDARWNPSSASPGSYTVNAKVDDGKGGTASCSADIRVEERPHHPPTASASANPSTILPGERSTVSCAGNSPDNLPLTYAYSASAGQVTGNGPQAQFDSTGLQPGSYPVKCEVTDSRGDKGEAATSVEVKEPPQVKQLEQRLALHSIYFPTALPTEAKPTGGLTASQAATLDTLASDFQQYLKYRPDAKLILEGHADIRGSKEYNVKLSERRVERARSYLIAKGAPADHLQTRAFGFEKNMTAEEVQKLIEADPDLSAAEKQKILKNLLTVRMANNRRVDVILSTTGEQSVRRFPFNAKDALTLLSRGGGETGKKKAPAATPRKP
jgi:outer membrane protein OmpA-like peptidoglycan-associated protein